MLNRLILNMDYSFQTKRMRYHGLCCLASPLISHLFFPSLFVLINLKMLRFSSSDKMDVLYHFPDQFSFAQTAKLNQDRERLNF